MQLQKLSRCEACFLQPAGLAVYGRHQAPVGELRALPLVARGIGGLLVLPLPPESQRKRAAGSAGYAPIHADGLANGAEPSPHADAQLSPPPHLTLVTRVPPTTPTAPSSR